MTPQEIEIANHSIAGKSLRQIEASTGIDDSTVARRLNKPEVQAYIENAKQELISQSLPKAVNNLKSMIDNYQTEKNSTKLEHGYRASTLLTEMVGITPSRTGNQINIAGNVVITPVIAQIISQYAKAWTLPEDHGEVIDVEG